MVLALVAYWVQLDHFHAQIREQARNHTQTLAGYTAQSLAQELNVVVHTLDYFSRQLGIIWSKGDLDSFDESARVAIDSLPSGALVQVAVADQNGEVRYSSVSGVTGAGSPAAAPITIADREHFTVHRDRETAFLHISRPIEGRISRQWTIQFTHGLWKNNEFKGVIVLAVSAEYLASALRAIFPDPTDIAALVNDQGIFLTRSHQLDEVLGNRLPANRPFQTDPHAQHGNYESVASVDGIRRLYSWRRINDFPLVVIVGLDANKAMALTESSIRSSQWRSASGSAILLLAGLTLALLYLQGKARAAQLQATAATLQTREAQLRITLDAVGDGLWAYDHESRTVEWDQRIRNILGYGDDYARLPFDRLSSLIHPSDRDHLESLSYHDPHASRDTMLNIKVRLKNKEGRWVWVLARGRAIEWDQHGLPLRSVGTLADISEHVAEALLRDALLNRSSAAILLTDNNRHIVGGNTHFTSMFLKPGQMLHELDLRDIHLDQAHWQGMADFYSAIRTHGSTRLEYPFRDALGNIRWFDIQGVLQDPDDTQSNLIWTWIDITSRREAHAALTVETLRLTTLLECFPGGVLIEDANDTVTFVNTMWPDLLGLDIHPGRMLGMHDSDLRMRLGPDLAKWFRSPHESISPEHRSTHEVTTPAGRYLEIQHVEIRQNDSYLGSVWLLRDITERKQHELNLSQLASTDTLTGLPNRRSFMEQLAAAFDEVRALNLPVGVAMMLDIDHFKRVNDSYGHAVGDAVLQTVAHTLSQALRNSDTPGRIGGEEFAVFLPHTNMTTGLFIAERIRQNVEAAQTMSDGQCIQVTISIGLSMIAPETPPRLALQQADAALYQAKSSGRNRVCQWLPVEVDTPQ